MIFFECVLNLKQDSVNYFLRWCDDFFNFSSSVFAYS